jgi:hypothetical protein
MGEDRFDDTRAIGFDLQIGGGILGNATMEFADRSLEITRLQARS